MSASTLPLCILAILLAAGPCLAIRPTQRVTDRTLLSRNRTLPSDIPVPPMAERRPHKIVVHGDVREDPYFWLRDDTKQDPDVLDYLHAENKYVEDIMADTEPLQEQLLEEMLEYVEDDLDGVPQRRGNYFYYARVEEGKQYSIHCRRKIPEGMGPPSELDEMDESVPEEILLDGNVEAEGHSYFSVNGLIVSPNEELVMYGVDTTGAERYTLHAKEISTGKDVLKEPIPGTSGNSLFASDIRTIFYATKNERSWSTKVWKHTLGTSPAQDELVYRGTDLSRWVRIARSSDLKYIFIHTGEKTLFIDSEYPDGGFGEVCTGNSCQASHRDGYFFIFTSHNHNPNGQINVAPVSNPRHEKVLIPHREDIEIEGFKLSKNFLVLYERREGLRAATVYRLSDYGAPPEILEEQPLEFDELVYSMGSGGQGDFESDVLRISFSSPLTPDTIIDHNMATGNRSVKKASGNLGTFNSTDYESKRIWVPATHDIQTPLLGKDAVEIPVSLVYRKDAVKLDGTDPLYLYVYGGYDANQDMAFSWKRLSLLDRGFVYAIAHVRGGGELGTYWHLGGSLLHKMNPFTDTIDCAEALVAQNYTSPAKMVIRGGSAGGTLVAGVINIRPDLFKAAIIGVPYVDLLTSLLDDSVPLTVSGWEEWGDPHIKTFYDYIKTYSPYDHIEAKDYPDILVTAGFNDGRVPYWRAAKYTAKLRSLKTDSNLLLMKTDFSSGHTSASGVLGYSKQVAMRYAFIMKALGIHPQQS